MRGAWKAVLLAAIVLLPSLARAQGTLTGAVTDQSGALLPGVTVEAASPALIEKSRTAVTDGEGKYRLTDLRPGIYSVTFSLTGFGTAKHEGITLNAGFTANIVAEMKVGNIE